MIAFAAAAAAAALRLLLLAGVAPAEPAPAEATVIDVAVVGSAADLARVRPLIRPKATAGAAVRWRRVEAFTPVEILQVAPGAGGAAGSTIRCWIDLGDRRRVRVYFAGRSGARFLIRDVDLSGRFDELDLVSLSEVIDLSLAAVLEDDRAGITRAEAERLLVGPRAAAPPPAAAVAAVAPPAPEPPPARRSAFSAGVGVFYAAETFAPGLPIASGPGVVASLPVAAGAGGRWQLGPWLSGQYQLPGSASGDLAGVRLTTVAARGGLLARWRPGGARLSALALEARVGGGADVVHLAPQPGTKDASAALTAARWSSSGVLTGAAGVVVALGASPALALGARAFADVVPIAAHYDVSAAGQLMTVVAPGRVRPGVVVDLTVVLGRADRRTRDPR